MLHLCMCKRWRIVALMSSMMRMRDTESREAFHHERKRTAKKIRQREKNAAAAPGAKGQRPTNQIPLVSRESQVELELPKKYSKRPSQSSDVPVVICQDVSEGASCSGARTESIPSQYTQLSG